MHFLGNLLENFLVNCLENFLDNFLDNFLESFLDNFLGNFLDNFLGICQICTSRRLLRIFPRKFLRKWTDFLGNLLGNFVGKLPFRAFVFLSMNTFSFTIIPPCTFVFCLVTVQITDSFNSENNEG